MVIPGLLVAGEAWARVGGGQSFSGGGSSGGYSGGSYSGGSGGSGGGLIQLLVWLIIAHPAVGVPLSIVVVVVVLYNRSQRGSKTFHSDQRSSRQNQTSSRAHTINLAPLLADDPNFSEPLFIDFAQLVYARVQRARGDGDMDPLRPLLSDKIRRVLASQRAGLSDVRDVIFGSTSITAIKSTPARLRVVLTLETNLTETRGGKDQQLLRRERWTFGRARGVLSPGPERMRSLGCPSCGSTLEPGSDGRCPNCETVRTGGASQWIVDELTVLSSRALGNLDLQLGGGVEPGTRKPTLTDPALAVQARALAVRHPAFSWAEFNQTVEAAFKKLQKSWSDQTWELVRPLETDALFQTHRFWMERYRSLGLVNRLDKVQVSKIEPARITTDAFFESITVRIFASMLDWTQRTADGKVVGGSEKTVRVFSEYWTFIRRIGGKAKPDGGGWQVDKCPSCGAPLDNVNQAGICGYCQAKITTGDFDWVLTRIEQDEVYRG
ncbi:MAG: TIM44-like domain-containing protein [Oligoflexia bacterium]|nr:TIM44-like domain-containing protein [Oligoflexia bacterium]